MPNIVTATEVAQFLKMRDNDGNALVPNDNTSPTRAELEVVIDSVEGEIEESIYQAYGHVVQTTETHHMIYDWRAFRGVPVYLSRTHCKPLDKDQGDKVILILGRQEYDITNSVDYFDENEGTMWIRYRGVIYGLPRLLITFRYGVETVPRDIKFAVLKLVAVNLIEGSLTTIEIDKTRDMPIPFGKMIDQWRDDVETVISRNRVWSYAR